MVRFSYFTIFSFFFSLVFFASFLLTGATNHANASTLKWEYSQGTSDISGDLRISSNHDVIYATIKTNGLPALLKSIDKGISFSLAIPYNQNVDIAAITTSHQNPNIVWIGAYNKGVYKSNDYGVSWNGPTLTNKAIRYLIVDPIDDKILYAGTGINDADGGIFKSIDGGAVWSQIGANDYGYKNCLNIYVDKHDHNRVIAGSGYSLYISENGGENWKTSNLISPWTPATIIDLDYPDTIYSYANDSGIYKSTDFGKSWNIKNSSMGQAFIFRLEQDSDKSLYATRRNGGGVWMSKDGAETWENVQDPNWGSRNTWGMDVRDGRIYVSVEGLGIFYADTQLPPPPPPPPPKPNPIVFVPGMLGSWSSKALVLHQQTQPEDWILTPVFTDDLYRPVTETLKTAGLKENENLFVFPYDWRQNIHVNSENLKNFLVNKVQPKNPNLKINLIGHSMGGMISSYCFEKLPDCTPLINKILTVGSPLKGALPAYRLWEGGNYQDSDPLMNILMSVALRIEGSPYLLKKDIVRQTMPGVKDLLPVFDYIQGRPYAQISSDGKNPILESLQNWSLDFKGKTHTFSSLQTNTDRTFQVTNPSNWESVLGLWTDGKPTSTLFEPGDGTVLNLSSSISEIPNDNFPTKHANYFTRADVLSGVLNNFGLTGQPVVQIVDRTSFLAFLIHSPASIKIFDQNANQVGTNVDDSFVILKNPIPNSNYFVELTGTGNGEYVLESYYASGSGEVINQKIAGTISTNDKKTVPFKLSNDFSQTFVPTNYEDYLIGFVKAISKVNDKNAELIKNRYVKAVKNTKNLTTWKQMRQDLIQSHYDLIRLLAKSRETLKRNAIMEADSYVINLNNYLHQKVYLHNKEEIVAEDDNGDLYKFLLPIFPDKKSYLIALNRSEAEIMRDLGKKYYQSGENFKARMYRRGSDLLQEGRF